MGWVPVGGYGRGVCVWQGVHLPHARLKSTLVRGALPSLDAQPNIRPDPRGPKLQILKIVNAGSVAGISHASVLFDFVSTLINVRVSPLRCLSRISSST